MATEEQRAYLEKLKSLQFCLHPTKGALRDKDKRADDYFLPPEPGKRSMGILIPSGGRLNQQRMDELIEAAQEKTEGDKRFHADEPVDSLPMQIECKEGKMTMEVNE